MFRIICLAAVFFLVSCKTTTYFIVRHAEKEVSTYMTSDVPLTEAGKQRALALKEMLGKKSIDHIYTTNYLRTRMTVAPLADAKNMLVELYDPRDTSFVARIRDLPKGNVVIVGHSNTVDDLVNRLAGRIEIPNDLPDAEYGDLFVVKKRGKKFSFEKKHFGN